MLNPYKTTSLPIYVYLCYKSLWDVIENNDESWHDSFNDVFLFDTCAVQLITIYVWIEMLTKYQTKYEI